jgi:hypothetical protein
VLETPLVNVADEHLGTLSQTSAGAGTADAGSRGRGDHHDLAIQ